jgi:hypothetical protein
MKIKVKQDKKDIVVTVKGAELNAFDQGMLKGVVKEFVEERLHQREHSQDYPPTPLGTLGDLHDKAKAAK